MRPQHLLISLGIIILFSLTSCEKENLYPNQTIYSNELKQLEMDHQGEILELNTTNFQNNVDEQEELFKKKPDGKGKPGGGGDSGSHH